MLRATTADCPRTTCVRGGCTAEVFFGLTELGAYCLKHRPVVGLARRPTGCAGRRRCAVDGCARTPLYGSRGAASRLDATHCSRHRCSGQLNLRLKRCVAPGCMIAANYGPPGARPCDSSCCSTHAPEGYGCTAVRACEAVGCPLPPKFDRFGAPPLTRCRQNILTYCERHRYDTARWFAAGHQS